MTTEKIEAGDYVQSVCTKCKKTTKNIVVGLVSGVPSKVRCTVCNRDHNYRKEQASKPATRAKSPARTLEAQDWRNSAAKWDEAGALPYSVESVFKKGDLLRHTVFGLGLVKSLPAPKRMHVLFETGEKLMVCGN